MKSREALLAAVVMFVAVAGTSTSAWAATTATIGSSGKTFASRAVQCAVDPTTNLSTPTVQAGLFNPKPSTTAVVSLNGTVVDARVTATDPVADVWLATGNNTVVVALSKKVADTYVFTVISGMCSLPAGNHIGPDGLEYAASGKSYATVTPGCALNGKTGLTQPYVNLFDNGGYLLNVSVNGVPLTQLSATRPHTPVFLSAGTNVIAAANGSLSTDYFVRDGGNGQCVLTQ